MRIHADQVMAQISESDFAPNAAVDNGVTGRSGANSPRIGNIDGSSAGCLIAGNRRVQQINATRHSNAVA